MKDYYQRSIKALQLAGLSERTQQCYTRAVRMVVEYHDKPPDKISEPELQDYSVTCSHCGGILKLRLVFLASRVILRPG